MTLNVRSMTIDDLHGAGEILYKSFNTVAARYGYRPKFANPRQAMGWAWSLFRHRPVEVFIGEWKGRMIGLCCLNPRGMIAGVGPVAVDPEYQAMHFGRRLMTTLIDHSNGARSLRLVQEAYNPASFALYHALGFMPVTCLPELFHPGDASGPTAPSREVIQLGIEDLPGLLAYDQPRSKSDRRVDFTYYLQWGKIFAYGDRVRMRGFLVCLPSPGLVTLGPMLSDTEYEAVALFRHAMQIYRGNALRARVMARDFMMIEDLKTWGFKLSSINNVMVKGDWRPGVCIECFGMFPEGI